MSKRGSGRLSCLEGISGQLGRTGSLPRTRSGQGLEEERPSCPPGQGGREQGPHSGPDPSRGISFFVQTTEQSRVGSAERAGPGFAAALTGDLRGQPLSPLALLARWHSRPAASWSSLCLLHAASALRGHLCAHTSLWVSLQSCGIRTTLMTVSTGTCAVGLFPEKGAYDTLGVRTGT